jgi:hypothetical protein
MIGATGAAAPSSGYVNILRQTQQGSGVIWDRPVESSGEDVVTLPLENRGAAFQLWSINQSTGVERLVDQTLLNAYLPSASLSIKTLDSSGRVPRTRIDQPFRVEINATGLLVGDGFPLASSSILLDRYLLPACGTELAENRNPYPADSRLISVNGKTVLEFAASALTASDPTRAAGEERFVLHVMAGKESKHTRIAAGLLKVMPVASGEIKGIAANATLSAAPEDLELVLTDLYPRSDTYLMLFPGPNIHGVDGSILKSHPLNTEDAESTTLHCKELGKALERDGTYTLALISDTVYGRELLCPPVTFHLQRGITAGPAPEALAGDGPS